MADSSGRIPDCDDEGERGRRGHRGHRGHDGPTGPTGPTGSTGATGPTGATGSSVVFGPPTSPARVLDVPFQPDVARQTFVMYSVRILVSPPGAFSAIGRVELRSDVNNPPTTVRARFAVGTSQGPAEQGEGELSYIVQAGDFVELTTVNEAGVPTYTLTTVTEIPIG